MTKETKPRRTSRPRGKPVYTVVDRWNADWKKTFRTRRACEQWLLDGFRATDGAEREHYAGMLAELSEGRTTLHYN